MNDLFERLSHIDDIKIANSHNVIIKLEIDKIEHSELYSIHGLYIRPGDFELPTLLFQLNSKQNEYDEILSVDQLRQLLYEELDKIYRCSRCSSVYVGIGEMNDNECPTCLLEIDYINSRPLAGCKCGLCDSVHWKCYTKKINCCKSGIRLCLGCHLKIDQMGFCPYCKNPYEYV